MSYWSIETGYSHKCFECGRTWYDSDGGCSCREDDEPETNKEEFEEPYDDE